MLYYVYRAFLAAVAATVLSQASPLRGWEPDESAAAQPQNLAVYPAAEPIPALAHPLTVPFNEQLDQNAAPMYMKAMLLLSQSSLDDDRWQQIDEWFNLPPGSLPLQDVQTLFSDLGVVLAQLEFASRQSHCNWELPLRTVDDPFMLLLPEAQAMRQLTRLISLRGRLQLAQGDMEGALRSIRTNIVAGRHVSRSPLLLNGLVGIALTQRALMDLEWLVQQPGAPNLYWSLTDLGNHPIDVRSALEADCDGVYLYFPELQPARRNELLQAQSGGDLQAVVERLARLGTGFELCGIEPAKLTSDAQLVDALMEKVLPEIPALRKRLIAAGHPSELVQGMRPEQVLLLNLSETYQVHRDNLRKAFNLPYPAAAPLLQQAEARLDAERKQLPIPTLLCEFLPAAGACRQAAVRIEQRLALARLIEALRMHAAAHDNQLPATLAALTLVPLPNDPATEEPFEYQLVDGTALIQPAAIGKDRLPAYRVTIAKPSARR